MDQYKKYMHTGLCERDKQPLPGRKTQNGNSWNTGGITTASYNIKISFDQFMNCMQRGLYKNMPNVLHFQIYDEAIAQTREECMLRFQFLKYLKQFPNATFEFFLSDSTLPAYIFFMNSLNWEFENRTVYHMSIDRNPCSDKKIALENAKGIIAIPEEKLLWFPEKTLQRISGKTNHDVLVDTRKLKRFTQDFMNKLEHSYRASLLNDFDKAYIAFHYLFDGPYANNLAMDTLGISYATEQTYIDPNGVQKLKPSSTRWESKPAGTLEHKRGVCSGQARLFNALISSPEMKIPAATISGVIPTGEQHSWSHMVIDNHILQCCTTRLGLFADLDKAGYKANENQVFADLYPHAYIPNVEKQKIKRRINQFKK